MLRRECIPPAFYRFICQEENFRYLNGRDVFLTSNFAVILLLTMFLLLKFDIN